jgi:nucleotide-binding universal stress UspA family protein
MKVIDSTTRVRFANIMFTTDLSPAAERALPYAIEIARRYQSKIHAAYVIPPDFYPLVPPAAWPKLAEEEAEFREDRRRHLDEQLSGVPHQVIFQSGDTWPALRKIIRDSEIDLIVLSTHGRGGLQKVLLGSVAEQIFRQAPCPVLSVGPLASLKHERATDLNRILFATDFSPESLAGAPFAISLAQEHRAQLILLHCLQNGGDISALRHSLSELIPYGADLRCAPDCIVERGAPASKILEVAEGHGADLIVIGIRGTDGALAKATPFSGSGTYKIVTHAKCPVLTIRG